MADRYDPASDPANHCTCGGIRANRPCATDCPLWDPSEDPDMEERRRQQREDDYDAGRNPLDDLEPL